MNLFTKHLIALDTPHFYERMIQEKISQLSHHESNGSHSIWHLNQYKDIVIDKAIQLDKLDYQHKKNLPLYGLTIGAKDLFCINGMKTTAGSKILEDFIAPYTATFVEQFQSKGGLITAKTSMDEFAMGSFTNTSYLGKTVIPEHSDYTAGGSSGGSAASLMANLFDFTLGSDTGGSVRQPAAFCGLVGFKPSYGSFSRYGMISYASSLDQAGIMTHSVDDLAYLINNIETCADIKDPTSLGINKSFAIKDIKSLTIGYFEEFLQSDSIDASIKEQYETHLKIYEKMGMKLEKINIPLLHKAAEIYYIIACAEASSNLARYQGVYFGKSLTKHLETHQSANDYWKDVANYRSSYFGKEVQKRILLGSYVLSSEKFDAIYKKAIKLRKDLSEQISHCFEKVDYLFLPTFPTQTPTWNEIEKMTTAQIYLADYMTIGFSLAGSPVITIPSTQQFDIEKTTGFQFVGKKYHDYQLIRDVQVITSATYS